MDVWNSQDGVTIVHKRPSFLASRFPTSIDVWMAANELAQAWHRLSNVSIPAVRF
jgi:hypothetical protein